MIRLFVIEDHLTVIISSLRYLFRPKRDGIVVTGSSTTVEETIKRADPGSFDVFVLDLYLPGHRPIENTRKLKEHFPVKAIAIYTSEKATSWRKRMMEEGAHTYITKDSTRDELKLALQKAAQGEFFYFGQMDSQSQPLEEDISDIQKKLTPVQKEIIKLLSEGHSHKEISTQIGISMSFIDKVLRNLRKSYGVSNNIELIKLFTRAGIL
jgi:DNA-binding NarL/FixJ family response regulator